METALAAAKLGILEQLEAALQAHTPAVNARDAEGMQRHCERLLVGRREPGWAGAASCPAMQ